MRKPLWIVGSSAALLGALVIAQVGPGARIGWDQPGPDLGTVQAYVYEGLVDGGTTVALAAACTGASSPFQCVAPLPDLLGGNHTIALRASNPIGASSYSAALAFTYTLPDGDGDGIPDGDDNCPTIANTDQADWNGNGIGDVCEAPGAPGNLRIIP